MLAFALLLGLSGDVDVRFVASSLAAVRAEPREGARTVVEVGIGTPVSVRKRAGENSEWAHVVVGPRVFRYESLDGEPVAIAPRVFDQRLPQGFIRVADLSLTAAPPQRRQLLQDATATRASSMLRAWALDPHDVDVKQVAAPTAKSITARRQRAPVERADLVFGCAGDIARASVATGTVASLGAHGSARRTLTADDVCIAALDVRPPCDAVRAKAQRAELARVIPRYGNDGPALRLVLGPGAGERPVWIVTRFLAVDGCIADECTPSVHTTEVNVTRLRVPRVEKGTTLLHVLVPRSVGVLYSIVSADDREDVDDAPQSFELGDAFDADPRDHEQLGDPAGSAGSAGWGSAGSAGSAGQVHLFAAPDVCSCTATCEAGSAGSAGEAGEAGEVGTADIGDGENVDDAR